MTLVRALYRVVHPEEVVEHLRQQAFSGRAPSSIAYGGILRHDVVEYGMGGCSAAGRSTVPSTAHYDDEVSSSTALAMFSGSKSSSLGERRLCRLWVVKQRGGAYMTTRGRRVHFFFAYGDTAQYNICSNVHYKEPSNRWESYGGSTQIA